MYFIVSPSAHLYHIVGTGLLEALKHYVAALSSSCAIEARLSVIEVWCPTGREIVF